MKKPFTISYQKLHVPVLVFLVLISTVLATIHPDFYNYIRTGTCVLTIIGLYLTIILIKKLSHWRFIVPKSLFINKIDLVILASLLYFIIRYFTSKPYNNCPENAIIYLIGYLCYFYLRIRSDSYGLPIKLILYTILIFGTLQALYALCQWFSILPNTNEFRIGGTYGNPGDLANVLIPCYAISINSILHEKNKLVKWFLSASILLLLSVLILSMARTAWIAAFIITLFSLKSKLYKLIKYQISKTVKFFIYLVLVSIMLLLILSFFKLYSLKQDSADGRLFIWKICTQIIKEKPILGHGYNSFTSTYTIGQSNYFQENPNDNKNGLLADDILFAYNDYIQIVIEYGVIGFIFFLAIVLLLVLKNNSETFSLIHSTAIVGILLCMATSYPLRNGTIVIVMMIFVSLKSSYDRNIIFKVTVPVLLQKSILLISLSSILVSGFMTYKVLNAELTWKQTCNQYFLDSDSENSYMRYQSFLPVLKFDKYFLYHYGIMLAKWDRSQECINHFENNYLNCLDSKMLIVLGECYFSLNKTEQAEKYYKLAINTKPMLFYPRYKLFKIYQLTHRPLKALECAKQLSTMKIKVFSQTVLDIKSEVNKYLMNVSLQ